MAKLTSRGRLPSKASLDTSSEDRLLRLLSRFGQEVDANAVLSSLERQFMQREGVRQIDDALLERLRKSVDQTFRGYLLDEARSAVSEYRFEQQQEDYGDEQRMRWWAVLDRGTCESCIARHNTVETIGDWEVLGKPGSANLICRKRCRCELHPVRGK